MWRTQAELQQLPISGTAWTNVKTAADANWGTADIKNQDSNHDTYTLAGALVYACVGNLNGVDYRTKTANAIMAAIGTEDGGRTLALGRNLISYVIAADLINLGTYDATKNQQFRTWLTGVRTETLCEPSGGGCRTLISTHAQRANNWGAFAGASRIAADLYLADTTDLASAKTVFQGWLGDRSVYAGFSFGDTSWQCNPSLPVAINPSACTKEGHPIDGALPEEIRRGTDATGAECGWRWPPCKPHAQGYVWGALQGAMLQAELLNRQGYSPYSWSNQALLRVADYLWYLDTTFPDQPSDPTQVGRWWATEDDEPTPWLINRAYARNFPTVSPATQGKGIAWTDWTHQP